MQALPDNTVTIISNRVIWKCLHYNILYDFFSWLNIETDHRKNLYEKDYRPLQY